MRNKAKECSKDRMETTTKDNGRWENMMVKELMNISLERNSKVFLKMARETARVKLHIMTAVYIKATFSRITLMGME